MFDARLDVEVSFDAVAKTARNESRFDRDFL